MNMPLLLRGKKINFRNYWKAIQKRRVANFLIGVMGFLKEDFNYIILDSPPVLKRVQLTVGSFLNNIGSIHIRSWEFELLHWQYSFFFSYPSYW